MRLLAGHRLGPYEILAPLGAGGMGEVYKARDTRLDRTVALKVLPTGRADRPDLRERFEREARAVSSLNHPHICTLYDVGHQDTSEGPLAYLVMEHIEGDTLADRLAKGPLPADQLLRYAIEIADALDTAHRQGVVHRDLKPGNIILAKTGTKLLDFGLARAMGQHPMTGDLTQSPTMSRDLTAEGTILGTIQYMAPEQLEGKEAGARTDIFAFGATLYEMATGKRAFEGKSHASLIAAIMDKEPPPMRPLAPLTPPALERVVRQCLAKDPEERWQTAGDLKRELHWIAESSPSAGMPESATAPAPLRIWWLLGVAGSVVIASVLGLAVFSGLRLGQGRPMGTIAFQQMSYKPVAIFSAAFAPDGETIVYSAAAQSNMPELFVIRRGYPEARPLGVQAINLLSISPKGELAVQTKAKFMNHRLFTGTLARMPLEGGAPREILENVRQADWSPDGSSLAIIRDVDGKDRLEFPIGRVLHETAGYLSDLRFSPRGDRIAFFEHPKKFDDRGVVAVVDLAGKSTVLSGVYWGEEGLAWSPAGDEVLFSAGTGYPNFSIYGMTLSGRTRPALQSAGGLTLHGISSDGRWLVTRDDYRRALLVLAPGESEEHDLSFLDLTKDPQLSPDGRTLLFTEAGSAAGLNYTVCLRQTDGSPVIRLGEGEASSLSPDGRWALATIPTSPAQAILYPTGPGEPRRLEQGGIESYSSGGWFPDGKSVLLCGSEPGHAERCYVQGITGGKPRAVTPEGTSRGARLWPDGERLLVRGPADHYVLYPLAGGEPRAIPWLAPDEIVSQFSRDGRSLFVFRPSEIPARIERVDIETGRRTPFKIIAPLNRAGALFFDSFSMADDEKSYAYSYRRQVSHLFVVEGAR